MKTKPHYLMQFFSYKHLPEKLSAKSKPFHDLAKIIDESVPDNPEKSAGLRKLLEAKDCVVRAMIFSNQPENEGGQKDMAGKEPTPTPTPTNGSPLRGDDRDDFLNEEHVLTEGQDLNELITKTNLTMVRFGAEWCGPCKSLKPIVDKIVDLYMLAEDVAFIYVDADKHPEVAQKFDIRGIPTTLFINKEGKVCKTLMGVKPIGDFENALKELRS